MPPVGVIRESRSTSPALRRDEIEPSQASRASLNARRERGLGWHESHTSQGILRVNFKLLETGNREKSALECLEHGNWSIHLGEKRFQPHRTHGYWGTPASRYDGYDPEDWAGYPEVSYQVEATGPHSRSVSIDRRKRNRSEGFLMSALRFLSGSNPVDNDTLEFHFTKKGNLERVSWRQSREGRSTVDVEARRFSRGLAETRPDAEPKTVEEMAAALRNSGVRLDPAVVRQIAASPGRTEALRSKDFVGEGTAFDHILSIARAGTLRDGHPANLMAADLLELVGDARLVENGARCYARTSHTIFSLFHPGEFARVLARLAVSGNVTLANGETIHWNPATTPVNGAHADYLWGALNQLIRVGALPKRAVLPSLTRYSERSTYAYKGQMANIFTRLTGERHVNVAGPPALPHLNEIVEKHGPMLAEYGAHGGSVAGVSGDIAQSLEAGRRAPQQRRGLGYVVIPESEAKTRHLRAIRYPAGATGYVKPQKRAPAPKPVESPDAAPTAPPPSSTP